MKTTTATAIFHASLASQNKVAPEWVELFPAGPNIVARDGRQWIANPDGVIAAFKDNEAALPVDYEHGQDLKAVNGDAAPAAGWIVELENRAGALWGKVEWLADAAKMITDQAYRYLSPAFLHDKSGNITRLLGAGLVNRPALKMTALSRETIQQENEAMSLKAIAKALGLADDASEAVIVAAIAQRDTERAALCQALKIDVKADGVSMTAAIAKMQDGATIAASATGKDLADLQAQLASLQKLQLDAAIDVALDDATKEGKITPASRDSYRAVCAAEGGLERFKAIAATLPVICAPSKLGTKDAVTDEPDKVDPVQLASRARKYQDEQAASGRTISISEAVLTVEAQKK